MSYSENSNEIARISLLVDTQIFTLFVVYVTELVYSNQAVLRFLTLATLNLHISSI